MAEESCDEKELICKYFKRRFEYVKKTRDTEETSRYKNEWWNFEEVRV